MSIGPLQARLQDEILGRGSDDILQYAELRGAAIDILPVGSTHETVLYSLISTLLIMIESGLIKVGPLKRGTVPLEVVAIDLPKDVMAELLWATYSSLGNPPELGGAMWVQLI